VAKMIWVMGGGVRPGRVLPPWVSRRLEAAFNVLAQDDVVVFSSKYSLNVPVVLSSTGFSLSEATVMAEEFEKLFRLSGKCFDPVILAEQFSHDSVGSIFFLFDFFLPTFDCKNVTIITSDFHKMRCQSIADTFSTILCSGQSFSVLGCDSGLDGDSPLACERRQKEIDSLKRFNRSFAGCKSRADILRVLVTSHSCYNITHSGDASSSALYR
jgi:hypothetical protein